MWNVFTKNLYLAMKKFDGIIIDSFDIMFYLYTNSLKRIK